MRWGLGLIERSGTLNLEWTAKGGPRRFRVDGWVLSPWTKMSPASIICRTSKKYYNLKEMLHAHDLEDLLLSNFIL
jgi:hypothetical protein